MSEFDDFINSQKIIYELKPISKKRERQDFTKIHDLEGLPIDPEESSIPFVKLLGGREPIANLKIRYGLYKKNWKKQLVSIKIVLHKTDRFKFRHLKTFLNTETHEKLTMALLNLGSNISNHSRLLNHVIEYLDEENICLIRLNANVCLNLMVCLKRIEDAISRKLENFKNDGIRKIKKSKKMEINQGQEEDSKDKESNDDNDDGNDDDDDDDNYNKRKFEFVGKFSDLDDLMDLLKKKEIKLTILIENADSLSTEIMTQLLMVMWRYSNNNYNVKMVIGISTPFIIFQEKIPKLTLKYLRTKSFQIDNSNEAINQIMEDLLLNINDTYNSLIFEPRLVLKFLEQKNEISIQKFYNFMKLIYMKHYFSEPLSIFWTNDFSKIELTDDYFEIFKKLPSVMSQDLNEPEIFEFCEGILNHDDESIGKFLRINLNKLINWRFNFRNLIDFLNFIQAYLYDIKIWSNNLHLFQLLFKNFDYNEKIKANNTNIFNFLDPIFKSLKNLKIDEINVFLEKLRKDEQFDFITKLPFFKDLKIDSKKNITFMINEILLGLTKQLNELNLDKQPFKEICVIDESVETILQESFNPEIRENSIKVLVDSKKWLFNKKYSKSNLQNDIELFKIFEPSLCEIYKIYREAGIIVNIYDFYMVFKNSILGKKKMIKLLYERLKIEKGDNNGAEHGDRNENEDENKILTEKLEEILTTWNQEKKEDEETNIDKIFGKQLECEEWDKLCLSWFLKGLAELEILGFLKEGKSKSDSIEKLIWRGL